MNSYCVAATAIVAFGYATLSVGSALPIYLINTSGSQFPAAALFWTIVAYSVMSSIYMIISQGIGWVAMIPSAIMLFVSGMAIVGLILLCVPLGILAIIGMSTGDYAFAGMLLMLALVALPGFFFGG